MGVVSVHDKAEYFLLPKYVATGDSLTDGYYATGGRGWAYLLSDALLAASYTQVAVTVAGHPGAGIDSAISSIAAELAAVHPQLVTVEWGINDLGTKTKAQFQTAYHTLLDLILAENATMTVLCCNIPWCGATMSKPDAIEYNEAIATEAAAFGFPVAHCWEATVDHSEYISTIDYFHPNDAGHAAIKTAAWDALVPVLGAWAVG